MAETENSSQGYFEFSTEYPYFPKVRSFETTLGGRRLRAMMEQNNSIAFHWLEIMSGYSDCYRKIPMLGDHLEHEPFWMNGMLPGLDAAMLYALVRYLNPRIYLEIGSGNSTKFVRRAI